MSGRRGALPWLVLSLTLLFFSSAFSIALPPLLGACGGVPCFVLLYTSAQAGHLAASLLGERPLRMKLSYLAWLCGVPAALFYLLLALAELERGWLPLLIGAASWALALPAGGASFALLTVGLARLEVPVPWAELVGWLSTLGLLLGPFLGPAALAAGALTATVASLFATLLASPEAIRHLPPYPSEVELTRRLKAPLLLLGLCEGVILYLPYRLALLEQRTGLMLSLPFFLYAALGLLGSSLLRRPRLSSLLHALLFAMAFLYPQALALLLPLLGLFSKGSLAPLLARLLAFRPGVRPWAQLRADRVLKLGITAGVVLSWALDAARLWRVTLLAAALSALLLALPLGAPDDQVDAQQQKPQQEQRQGQGPLGRQARDLQRVGAHCG
ncbi:MAG: hypothetical protein C4339_05415 [Nitrososphaerota archaeon]